jgi:hypothetical protein
MAKQGGFNIKVKLDRQSLQNAEADVKSVTSSKYTKKDVAEDYAELIDPYVPYRTGALATYGINYKGEIVYSAINSDSLYNYAGIQYTHKFDHPKNGPHPLATDHWDQVAKPIIWDEFVSDVTDIVRKRLKKRGS